MHPDVVPIQEGFEGTGLKLPMQSIGSFNPVLHKRSKIIKLVPP